MQPFQMENGSYECANGLNGIAKLGAKKAQLRPLFLGQVHICTWTWLP